MAAPPIRLPTGVRDFLPRAAARRRALAERVMAVFEAWGYARIITPVFEHADVLERGLGDGARAQAIRFVEPGTGEVVALRPDITPQIARVVATRLADEPPPLRLSYEGAVTRIVAAGELGQREILQAGVELVGAPAPDGDAEVLAVAAAALAAAGLPDVRLDVGHVAPARYVLDAAPTPEARRALVAAISRKDRAGVRAAARGLPEHVAPLAEALATLWGPADATLVRAAALAWPGSVSAALAQLRAVLAAFAELADVPAPAISIDLGDLRGEGYYTGVRFAGYATGAPDAVLRGGRYDELLARYGYPATATGFAIDLEMIAQAERAAGVPAPVRALGIAVAGDRAAAIARELRRAGLRAAVTAAPTPAWLRSAGFDAAVDITRGELVRSDDTRVAAADVIAAAADGDCRALIALIGTRGVRCVAIVAALAGCTVTSATPATPSSDLPPLAGGVELLVTPDPAGHPAFVRAIAGAKHGVRLAMFHLTDPEVVDALLAAHGRGVDVRVILDGKGLASKRSERIAAQLRDGGVAVKGSSKGFSITHEKALLVDDDTILITAINLTKTATDTRDFGLVLHDPGVIAEFAAVFAADWDNADTGGKTTPKLTDPHLVWSPVDAEAKLAGLAGSAHATLIATVENLGDAKILAGFARAAQAGAHVRLIVPACDKDREPTRNFSYVYALQRANVDVRVMPAPSSPARPYMHSKMMIADGARGYVGSINFSANSATRAREVGVVFGEPEILASIAKIFEADWSVAIEPPATPPADCPGEGE